MLCYVNILPQFRTNVSLFEYVICLVLTKLWNFQEAGMQFDKSIEYQLWSYPFNKGCPIPYDYVCLWFESSMPINNMTN